MDMDIHLLWEKNFSYDQTRSHKSIVYRKIWTLSDAPCFTVGQVVWSSLSSQSFFERLKMTKNDQRQNSTFETFLTAAIWKMILIWN